MDRDDQRVDLLERVYQRGYELRLRRRRRLATFATVVVIGVVGVAAITVARTDNPKVSVGRTLPSSPSSCGASIDVVPKIVYLNFC